MFFSLSGCVLEMGMPGQCHGTFVACVFYTVYVLLVFAAWRLPV